LLLPKHFIRQEINQKNVHESVQNPLKKCSRVNTFWLNSGKNDHFADYKNLISCGKMRFFEVWMKEIYTFAVNTLNEKSRIC